MRASKRLEHLSPVSPLACFPSRLFPLSPAPPLAESPDIVVKDDPGSTGILSKTGSEDHKKDRRDLEPRPRGQGWTVFADQVDTCTAFEHLVMSPFRRPTHVLDKAIPLTYLVSSA